MLWKTIPLKSNCSIEILDKKVFFHSDINKKIEYIWNLKKRENPNLFNGRVFTVTNLSDIKITGFWTEYKFIVAQMKNHQFYQELNLQPLAITGLIRCPEGFILGKRNNHAIYMSNYWQTCPAGSIESRNQDNNINLIDQLFAELQEELGLDKTYFQQPILINATTHPETHIIDLGFSLKTNLSFENIRHHWIDKGNTEYDELICISNPITLPNPIIPTAKNLIKEILK